jgi:drug/metabolite transporter (DMT)-like permease
MGLKNISLVALILFGSFSAWVVSQVGYFGVFQNQLDSPAGWQVIIDLIIACLLLLAWIVPDAKSKGRNPWPFIVLTLLLGAIGPLAYFATDKSKTDKIETRSAKV